MLYILISKAMILIQQPNQQNNSYLSNKKTNSVWSRGGWAGPAGWVMGQSWFGSKCLILGQVEKGGSGRVDLKHILFLTIIIRDN